ncbi:trehalase-like [Anoplophora glabripennis]|uniref:trehalase-like n=1 Tax=Anoplophora glabripennis TaxID=217634 RepID=UPI000874D7FA|nr:trehalase-like [Anoplophora glabripennis]
MKLTTVLAVLVCGRVCVGITQFCDSPIYCVGDMLDVVQKSKIFQDSKSFVDMSQINRPNETLRNFNDFMRNAHHSPSQEQIRSFVEENFVDESGLEDWMPSDYDSSPLFLEKISDDAVRGFAQDLIGIWPTLGRKVKKDVRENPDKHSLIYVPNGFVIPGGRFREMYYWDSYWIVKGLLISGMKETVRGILDNFIYLVERYGFVPNGSRVYYLNRSQPPLFALMVGLYVDFTNNVEWLQQNIGVLEKELKWWLNNRVTVVKKDGKSHMLAHFSSEADTPRPESYFEDVKTCAEFEQESKKNCYMNLRSGAESGWDFSSRWMFHQNHSKCSNLTHIQVTRIAPVDLNSYLCKAFRELSRFYTLTGDSKKSFQWLERSFSWEKSIESVFYDNQDGIWYDYDITSSKSRKAFYLSNFAPLWCQTFDASLRREYGSRAVSYLNSLEIGKFEEGVPTSLKESGQQWDRPNAFPPLQEILILGLLETGQSEAKELATIFAHRWIVANIRSYNKNGVMFEKYHAENPDQFATGGEYRVQSGFGWTNGVALSIIEKFYVNK